MIHSWMFDRLKSNRRIRAKQEEWGEVEDISVVYAWCQQACLPLSAPIGAFNAFCFSVSEIHAADLSLARRALIQPWQESARNCIPWQSCDMNEVGLCLHGHFSEGCSNGLKPVEGKSPPLWGEQESRTARVNLEGSEGQGIGTSHWLSSGNLHTQKQKRVCTTGPLCSHNARWHQTVHMDIHVVFPAIAKYTGDLV